MAKKRAAKKATKKSVETITHDEDKRAHIPTAELESVVSKQDKEPVKLRYPRNTDLDPQLVWRGKDEQDQSDLGVNAPPLYIQEKVHPKVLIDDLLRETKARERGEEEPEEGAQFDLFGDFNGIPEEARSTEFYQHEANWTNRMILGDSLQVMASLAEREGLRGKVQCIYIDPPYGIRFNSNFQWSTTSRDVKDGKADHITREPEQVRAFRDTWRDGIHSYLTYLRDRLTVARDLLSESGSIFVQIGDENVHRVRTVVEEVFGEKNFCAQITVVKTAGQTSELIAGTSDFVLWFAKCKDTTKFRKPLTPKGLAADKAGVYRWVKNTDGTVRKLSEREAAAGSTDRVFRYSSLTSQRPPGDFPVELQGREFGPGRGFWKTGEIGMSRLIKAGRVAPARNSINYIRFIDDFAAQALGNVWGDTGTGSFTDEKVYVVQTGRKLIQRCILMATDPGDLILDPTCGSGTSASVAEQWGRRWITVDTSRVALALARARIMGARHPYYLLEDSQQGQLKEAEIRHSAPTDGPFRANIRQGFVYERVPHIMLKDIANNSEIDVIWENFQRKLEPIRKDFGKASSRKWEEWEIPRGVEEDWSDASKTLHADWWKLCEDRQKAIDDSIKSKSDFDFLYDKPYEDKTKVRVAGPFTVESLSPHRMLGVDENDELIDPANQPEVANLAERKLDYGHSAGDFATVIIENLKTAGVQQSAKEDKINFSSITPWPGEYICAEAHYSEGKAEPTTDDTNSTTAAAPDLKRAGVFIGPEFGTVSRSDLVAAAREAGDAGFDVLIACAFNYDAHSSEFDKLGRIPVLKARMNADLHMADDLKNTGKGNLFVIFGEPDIDILEADNNRIQIRINGVDVFKPSTGDIVSDSTDGIACWFIDTSYNEESFFVRQAYFLGASDPYKSLKTTLKAEIDEDAWSSLNSDTSRPFRKPLSGRIAVKVINHLGDEVMKVFKVE